MHSSTMVAFNRLASAEYDSVKHFLHMNPLCQKESPYIHKRENLVILRRAREHALLDLWAEHLLRMFPKRLVQVCDI